MTLTRERGIRRRIAELERLASGEAVRYLQSAEEVLAEAEAFGKNSELHLRALNEYGNACRINTRYSEALEVFSLVSSAARDLPAGAALEVEAQAQLYAAIVHDVVDSLSDGLGHLSRATELYGLAGDAGGLARARMVWGAFYMRTEKFAEARSEYEQALAWFEQADEQERAVSARSNLTMLYRMMGLYDKAIASGRAAAREARGLVFRASALSNLALVYSAAGRSDEADAAVAESGRLFTQLGDLNYLAGFLYVEATIRHQQNRLPEALGALERLLDLGGEVRKLRSAVNAYALLSLVHEELGNYAEALMAFREYHELATAENREKAALQLELHTWKAELENTRAEAERERLRHEQLAESFAALQTEHERVAAHAEQLEIHSYRDALTEVANRRYFDERLAELVTLPPLGAGGALLMVDLDDFKAVNDRHGHLLGDRVLREVARLLEGAVRRTDLVARLGGEEFAVLFTAVPEGNRLQELAEKIRNAIASSDWEGFAPGLTVTASVGGALLAETGVDGIALLELADTRLYAAKKSGRNRVVVSG